MMGMFPFPCNIDSDQDPDRLAYLTQIHVFKTQIFISQTQILGFESWTVKVHTKGQFSRSNVIEKKNRIVNSQFFKKKLYF